METNFLLLPNWFFFLSDKSYNFISLCVKFLAQENSNLFNNSNFLPNYPHVFQSLQTWLHLKQTFYWRKETQLIFKYFMKTFYSFHTVWCMKKAKIVKKANFLD